MSNYDGIIKLINKSRTIAVISHISPDGDTVGSAIALYEALKMYGKEPYIFSDDDIPEKLSIIGDVTQYNRTRLDSYDLAISVDTASYERMGGARSEFEKARKTAVIDHHISNTRYASVNVVEEAAATAEIMVDLISEFTELNDKIARALYAGLVTDTGCFQYSSVTPNTFRVAGILKQYDISAHILTERLMSIVDKKVFDLRNRVLAKAEFYHDGKIAIAVITAEDFKATETTSADTDGIVNILRSVKGVAVGVVMTEHVTGIYKLSIRTNDDVNANYVAMQFGGGGHMRASGCRIAGALEEVRERVLKACADELPF